MVDLTQAGPFVSEAGTNPVSWTKVGPTQAPSAVQQWKAVALSGDGMLMALSDGVLFFTNAHGPVFDSSYWIQQTEGPGAVAIAISDTPVLGEGPGPNGANSGYPNITAANASQVSAQNKIAVPNLSDLIISSAAAYGIDADTLARQLYQESHFRVDVTSPTGAIGIAQFFPAAAADAGLPYPSGALDPNQAVPAAARYLALQIGQMFDNLGAGLGAYNQGVGGMTSYLQTGSIPGAGNTQQMTQYVQLITGVPIGQGGNFGANAAPGTWLQPSYQILVAAASGFVMRSRNNGSSWRTYGGAGDVPSFAGPGNIGAVGVAISSGAAHYAAIGGSVLWTWN